MNLQLFAKNFVQELKPSKFQIYVWVFKLLLIIGVGSYYIHAVRDQMLRDDNPDLFTSIGRVVKDQYDFVTSPFLGLLKRAEGFENNFYADNKGYAVGYGYNPTQNSEEYNKNILDYAGVDSKTKQRIIQNAGKYRNTNGGAVPSDLKDIHLTKEQLDRMAMYAKNSYEQSFFRVLNTKLDSKGITGQRRNRILNAYVELPDNKKAVLIHMTYKVGEANLAKYSNFFTNLISYLENPSSTNKEAVAGSFTYKYKKDGRMLNDTRVERLHHDLFVQDMPRTTPTASNSSEAKPVKVKLTKKQLSDQEKFDKAMKEVNSQINVNSVVSLLIKAADKINETFPGNKQGSHRHTQDDDEYESYFEM